MPKKYIQTSLSGMSALSAHYATTRTKDEHITIEWENLHYSVLTKDSKKSTAYKSSIKNNRILKNVCGRAESGQLLAIMGPTGSNYDISATVKQVVHNLTLSIQLIDLK